LQNNKDRGNKGAFMQIKVIQTHRIEPNEFLKSILDRYIPKLAEQTIVVITSKIISLCQGRVVPKSAVSKEALIRTEADAILQTTDNPYDLYLTIKNNILIPSAGIDESNGDGVYILYPQDVQSTAVSLWYHLRETHALEHLGILITDSHTTPMRRGTTGIALGWCGFEPLYCYIGKPDLYEKPLRVTQSNLLDGLASAAVLVMGEGNEQTPLTLIQDAPRISFQNRPPTTEEEQNIMISMAEDLYAPLLKGGKWIRR
jgi:putative folate metabolism gamma-glutamate ligase